jgi:hypothetical protein
MKVARKAAENMDTHQHAPGVPVAPDFLAAMAEGAVMPLWDRYHQCSPIARC